MQEKSLNKIPIVLLLFCSIVSCKKDRSDPNCKEFGSPNSLLGWQELYEPAYVAQPDFNPDNASEFLFVHYPSGSSNKLYKYNTATKELKLIFTGTTMIYRSRYGKNGWVLLNLIDGNIWKIKDNGDSLTQLTFTGDCYHPHWNYLYNLIGFSSGDWGYIMNTNGNVIDTLKDHYKFNETATWLSPIYLVTAMFSVYTYKVESNELDVINDFESPGSGSAYGISILMDDNSIIWSYRLGIFETKIDTRNTRSLYPSCNSRRFYDASYAPATNKLLWQRLDYRPVWDSSLLYIRSSIVMMNTDGMAEEKIEIPLL